MSLLCLLVPFSRVISRFSCVLVFCVCFCCSCWRNIVSYVSLCEERGEIGGAGGRNEGSFFFFFKGCGGWKGRGLLWRRNFQSGQTFSCFHCSPSHSPRPVLIPKSVWMLQRCASRPPFLPPPFFFSAARGKRRIWWGVRVGWERSQCILLLRYCSA